MVVFDTSPLIFLDQLGYLPALRELHGSIAIPQAVSHELGRRPDMPAAHVPELDWVEVREVRDDLLARVLDGPPSLDSGEAEAIALALGERATVVVDDSRGRARARKLGVTLTGTIGELLVLHRLGMANTASRRSPEEELDALRDAGMRLTDALQGRLLRELKRIG